MLPFEGIRVTDLGVVWSGPMAATLLADLGAEVIHLENLRHPPTLTRGVLLRPTREQTLTLGPLGSGYPDHEPGERPWNRAAMFNAHGRNKRCATVDLTQASGHDIFLRLIEKSDVFIENNARTTLEHLGLDAGVLLKANPQLIVLRMPPLGLNGPFAEFRGFGPTFNSLAGVTAMGGYHDADLTSQGDNYHMDEAAAPAAAFAVMAALWRREQTGVGQLVEFPQVENLIQQLGEFVLSYQLTHQESPLYGNRDPYRVQGVYPCLGTDRWIAISLRNDADWEALKRAMGEPEWAHNENFATHLLRLQHQDALDEQIASWTGTLRVDRIHRLLQSLGIPAGPVMSEADAYADPHLAERGFFRPMTHPEAGTHLYPGHGWRYSELSLRWERPAPRTGEDNEYVYKTVLGYSDQEYRQFVEVGHVGMDFLVG